MFSWKQPSLGLEKNCSICSERLQGCWGMATEGMPAASAWHWQKGWACGKQGTQLKNSPRLHKDARNQPRRDQRAGERLQAEPEGCSPGTSWPWVCCACRERGRCLPRSRGRAAFSSRDIHGVRDAGRPLRYTKFVNRHCQSFSLVWEFQSLLLMKWLITHLFGFLDPLVCFSPLQLISANEMFIWCPLIPCCYKNNIPALRVFSFNFSLFFCFYSQL